MASKANGETKPADPRGIIVDALMTLAGERRFEDISIREICQEAGLTLADFRDFFPSKGAVLAGFYSYGEIAPHGFTGRCELHNQTMTVTTIGEE